MLFREVAGQKEIKARLLQMAKEQRVAHALLFAGSEGTGKLPLAIAFARYLNCLNPGPDDSCSECISCRKYSKLEHPDLHFVFPVVKKRDAGKDDGKADNGLDQKPSVPGSRPAGDKEPVSDDYIGLWRETVLANPYMRPFQWYEQLGSDKSQGLIYRREGREIIKKLSLKNFEAQYKVMIIWMVEKMQVVSSNTLLKILEEPPDNTLFILIAEDAGRITPTILSRIQLFNIKKIDRESMELVLREKHGIEDKKRIENLVRIADGNYLALQEALGENGGADLRLKRFISLMRLCYAVDITSLSDWVEEMAGEGRERQKQFLQYSLGMLRGNFIMNIKAGDIDLLSDQERDFSVRFSKFIHPGNIVQLTEEINRAFMHIEHNGYSRLVFFDLGLKLARLLKA